MVIIGLIFALFMLLGLCLAFKEAYENREIWNTIFLGGVLLCIFAGMSYAIFDEYYKYSVKSNFEQHISSYINIIPNQ